MNAELREAVERALVRMERDDPQGVSYVRQALRDQEAEIARLRKDHRCVHMFGADGDGSSCYLCGKANPRNAY